MLDKHRLTALDLACHSVDGGWLKPDARGINFGSPGRMIQLLQDKNRGVTIFNVVGADSVVKLCKNGSKFMQAMVVVGRAGSNNKVVQETAELSEAAGAPVYYVEELPGAITSTDVLAALQEGDEEMVRTLIPPSAAEYLLENREDLFGENYVPVKKPPKFVPSRGERNFNLLADDGPSTSKSERPARKGDSESTGKENDETKEEEVFQKHGVNGYSAGGETTDSGTNMPDSAYAPPGGRPLIKGLPPGKPACVVGITGAPSAGKTSLAQELQYMLWERYGARSTKMISQQDFDLGSSAGAGAWSWEHGKWLSYWESPDATDWKKMEHATLEATKHHPIVIVEGHCLFSSERMCRLLNGLIWMDVDQEGCWDRRAQYPEGWEPAHYFYKCLWPGHEEHLSQALGVQKWAPGCGGRSAGIGPTRSLSLNGLDQPTALRERALNAVLRWALTGPSDPAQGPPGPPGRALPVPGAVSGPMLMQCQ